MRSVDIGLKAAMIVTPVNVLHNWRHEFTKWRPTEFKPLRVYMLEDVPRFYLHINIAFIFLQYFFSLCLLLSINKRSGLQGFCPVY